MTITLVATVILLHSLPAHATSLPMEDFSRLPVVHEGRVKPLSSFAHFTQAQLSGKADDSTAWLAETLFDPATAMEKPVLHIESAHLRDMLSLPEYTTLMQASTALETQAESLAALAQKEESTLTEDEHALLGLYANTQAYAELLRSFSLLLPLELNLSPETRTALNLPEGTLTYLEVLKSKETLLNRVKATAKEKNSDVSRYTPQEQEFALLSFHLNALEQAGARNQQLRILPSPWQKGEWYAPWALLLQGQSSPETMQQLRLWQQLADAYRAEDSTAWLAASHTLLGSSPAPLWRLKLEQLYYKLHLLEVATALYALAFAVLLVMPCLSRHPAVKILQTPSSDGVTVPAKALYLFALATHGALLLMRMLILGRPPVSTLYESVLFVSFVVALGAFLWRGKLRKERWLAGSGLGAFLLLISHVYAADGDTMGVLVAVLNTNFWLATHVLCITAGYGWCLIAATLAHIWLFKAARGKGTKQLPKHLHLLSIIALMFTALGTILGGIWADQSWGRFWGWDPKENGALLIVLWLIWLLHGRVSGMMGTRGYIALLALTNVIVAVSWFGVNLLNVGLHSYGFTDSAAYGLAAFCLAECALVGWLYTHGRNKIHES